MTATKIPTSYIVQVQGEIILHDRSKGLYQSLYFGQTPLFITGKEKVILKMEDTKQCGENCKLSEPNISQWNEITSSNTQSQTTSPQETPTPPEVKEENKVCSEEKLFSFDQDDTSFWYKADGYNNGNDLFMVGWREENVEFKDGFMHLHLNNSECPDDCSTKSYGAGNYQTLEKYKFGWYEARLKASGISGTVTSLFTYTGPSDGNQWDEIDIEIVGTSPTKMQINYWTNGIEHPKDIDLGFDASQDFHTYAFEWKEDSIKWYVDGNLVHTEDGSRGTLPTAFPMKTMMNYWAAQGWDKTGVFSYKEPSKAKYDYFKYKPLSCLTP